MKCASAVHDSRLDWTSDSSSSMSSSSSGFFFDPKVAFSKSFAIECPYSRRIAWGISDEDGVDKSGDGDPALSEY